MINQLVSAQQLMDKELLQRLFKIAEDYRTNHPDDYPKLLKHKILASLFYEPSTRTRLSFETAVMRLSGRILTAENALGTSSAVKGESIEDTIRVMNGYVDGIIMRHPEVGSAKRAASMATVPFFNAGDGGGEHPTQALLDMYTIFRSKQSFDGLNIALVGDLLHSRTMHSLLQLLSMYKVNFYLVSPTALQLPDEFTSLLKNAGTHYEKRERWDDIAGQIDVVYSNRIQAERFDDRAVYEKLKDSFCITKETMKSVKKDMILMNPLPRVSEILPEVDDDPRAIYFEQSKNGVYARMALLTEIYG